MKVLGWAVIVCIVLGALNIIDFHVCIKMPGDCSVEVTK
jgi:hypothetical protein